MCWKESFFFLTNIYLKIKKNTSWIILLLSCSTVNSVELRCKDLCSTLSVVHYFCSLSRVIKPSRPLCYLYFFILKRHGFIRWAKSFLRLSGHIWDDGGYGRRIRNCGESDCIGTKIWIICHKCFLFFFETLYTWNCAAACRHVLCCTDTTHCDDFKHFSRREIKFLFVSHVLGGWQNIVGLLAVCFYTLETLLWWYFPQISLNKCILYFQRKGEYVCETLQQWLSTAMSDVANDANAHNS